MANPLRFVTYLAPNMLPVYHFITEYIGRQLDRPTELSTGQYATFAELYSGAADVAFICSRPYIHLRRHNPPLVEPLAAPVLQGERYRGRPIYFSDVIVRHDSPFQQFSDLRGRSWAYNDPHSHSGYGVTLYHLARLGETNGFFGRVVEAGYHQKAIRLVAAGKIDAAAIDSQVLAIEQRDHPEITARLRVIDTLGPSTIQPIVAAHHLPPALRAEIQAALLHLHHDPAAQPALAHGYNTPHPPDTHDPAAQPALAHGFITHLAPVTDATYDDVRTMMTEADTAGLTTLHV
jgi:phosphonate transport system substrate-binding protein